MSKPGRADGGRPRGVGGAPTQTFALRVKGESMIDDGIRDGDFVVVEKRKTAHNGQTVVALLDDG